jgi:hypothetical protein
MNFDLEKGISFKIEGELGKYQTLPIDALIKIAETFQNLVLSIAKNDLSSDNSIDYNNFKIELTDFTKSSSVPSFVFTPRIQHTTSDYKEQRNIISSKLVQLFEISDKGDYSKIKDYYPSSNRSNDIIENLYDFTNSFKDSPTTIFSKDNLSLNFKVKKFKSEVKKSLLTTVVNLVEDKVEHSAIARLIVTTKGKKTSNRIQEIISGQGHTIAYSPEIINVSDKQYILKFPLHCSFIKEDDFYVIKNELIDITATGLTVEEVELDFNEEFDFLFTRINEMDDNKLSKRMQDIKLAINLFVKEKINGIR